MWSEVPSCQRFGSAHYLKAEGEVHSFDSLWFGIETQRGTARALPTGSDISSILLFLLIENHRDLGRENMDICGWCNCPSDKFFQMNQMFVVIDASSSIDLSGTCRTFEVPASAHGPSAQSLESKRCSWIPFLPEAGCHF